MSAWVPVHSCGTVPSTLYLLIEGDPMNFIPENIERFRVKNPSLKVSLQTTKASRSKSWFLKGPIPGDWLHTATGLPGRSLHVGLAIWFKHGLTKKQQFNITPPERRRFNIPDHAFRRGVRCLEEAGLIQVERRTGRPSLIRIICD